MSRIYFLDKKIGEFKYPIRSILYLEYKMIVLLEVPSNEFFSENVFCINNDGEVLWQIEKNEMLHPFSSYYELALRNNSLFVFSSGIERKIDIDSGKILNTEIIN